MCQTDHLVFVKYFYQSEKKVWCGTWQKLEKSHGLKKVICQSAGSKTVGGCKKSGIPFEGNPIDLINCEFCILFEKSGL